VSYLNQVLAVCVALLVAVTLEAVRYARKGSRLRRQLSESIARCHALESKAPEENRALQEATQAVDLMRTALEKANKEADDALRLAAMQKKRADEQFAVIEDFEKEKRRIWEIYRDSCYGAGNCQDLLLSELSRISRIHHAMAKKHNFDPAAVRPEVREAIDEFSGKHRDETAVRAGLDQYMGRTEPSVGKS